MSDIWDLIPAGVFLATAIAAIAASRWVRHRFEKAGLTSLNYIIQENRPPSPQPKLRWLIVYALLNLAGVMLLLGAADSAMVAWDFWKCKTIVTQILTNSTLDANPPVRARRNLKDWESKYEDTQPLKAWITKYQASQPDTPVVWQPGDPVTVDEGIGERLLDALIIGERKSLRVDVRGFVVGANIRSVFHLASKLRPKNSGQALELATLFGDADKMNEIITQPEEEEALSLTPRQFDEFRIQLLGSPHFLIDTVRSAYTGILNLGIIVVAVVLYSKLHLQHRVMIVANDSQQPVPGEHREPDSGIAIAIPNLTWASFWGASNFGVFQPLVANAYREVGLASQSPSLTLELVHRLLVELKSDRNPGEDVRSDTFYARVNAIGSQVAEQHRASAPARTDRAQRVPELLTELGFLGTIIGVILGMSAAALTQVPSADPLYRSLAVGNMMGGLSVAFSTTLVGLLGALWVKYRLSIWSDEELDSIAFVEAATTARFRQDFESIFAAKPTTVIESISTP